MPKVKRTSIGYVRPKKRPVSQDQELPEEPTNTTESEDIPEEAVPMQPEARTNLLHLVVACPPI